MTAEAGRIYTFTRAVNAKVYKHRCGERKRERERGREYIISLPQKMSDKVVINTASPHQTVQSNKQGMNDRWSGAREGVRVCVCSCKQVCNFPFMTRKEGKEGRLGLTVPQE